MAADSKLISRSGDLKRELFAFARGPRFAAELNRELEERFGKAGVTDKERVTNFIDHFLLQHRLGDGRTLVEHFLTEHPKLPPAERAMLIGWQDVLESIFEVKGRDGEALIAFNLIDELTYRVRSNMGPGGFAKMPVGSFLVARLVPVEDEWLLSGASGVIPSTSKASALRLAREMAMQHPGLVFRNPAKLEQAWEHQREDRRAFIAFFGSDAIVLPGAQLARRMQEYTHFRVFEMRDTEGKSAADRTREAYGATPSAPEMSLPQHLHRAETVGLIYDEVDGLNFFAGFGLVEETFADPTLVADRRHRDVVLAYLEEPSITPLPFRRLAERYPKNASRVFQQVLNQPGFLWERGGEALLRRYKANYFERKALPSTVPIGPHLMEDTVTAWKAAGKAFLHPTPLHDRKPAPKNATTKRGKDRRKERK